MKAYLVIKLLLLWASFFRLCWIIGAHFSLLPSAQCLQMADSLPGASLRFSANCIALTHCCQLHTPLVGPLSPPVGFYIGTPLFKKPFLARSHYASVDISGGKILDNSQDVVSVYAEIQQNTTMLYSASSAFRMPHKFHWVQHIYLWMLVLLFLCHVVCL